MSYGPEDSLDIATLSFRYARGEVTPAQVLAEVQRRISTSSNPAIWIDRLSKADIDEQLARVQSARATGAKLPLYGIPFAVKDNIDVAGWPTTAACREFAYTPAKSATVVRKLQDAGAILVGKTNLDQFATGLVGVRSPFGVPNNPFNPEYITGGSSSGSAAAVASGLVSFSLGTDTAGSGRVPAGFNNLIGLKPTRGLLSCAGVVPACQSLDCVSIFALTCGDAGRVAEVTTGFDAADPYSRPVGELHERLLPTDNVKFGIPRADQLNFFGNTEYERLFHESIARMESLGFEKVVIDFAPFQQAGDLLYKGPWIAERVAGLRGFLKDHMTALLPAIAKIFSSFERFSAADAFDAEHQLAAFAQASRNEWEKMDLLLLPTTGTIYTQAQIAADPIALNLNLGYYTQFVNLLDLSGVAVPAGFIAGGLPGGVTLIGRAGQDGPLLQIADKLHRAAGLTLGATGRPIPNTPMDVQPSETAIAVVGAHLSGQPLNWQLTSRGGRLLRTAKTAAVYQLFALANTTPPKPGLVRVEPGAGEKIELEIWQLTRGAFGSFVAEVPAPMVIGTIQLEDGSTVKGFLCEPAALAGAQNITQFGGWRAYLASR